MVGGLFHLPRRVGSQPRDANYSNGFSPRARSPLNFKRLDQPISLTPGKFTKHSSLIREFIIFKGCDVLVIRLPLTLISRPTRRSGARSGGCHWRLRVGLEMPPVSWLFLRLGAEKRKPSGLEAERMGNRFWANKTAPPRAQPGPACASISSIPCAARLQAPTQRCWGCHRGRSCHLCPRGHSPGGRARGPLTSQGGQQPGGEEAVRGRALGGEAMRCPVSAPGEGGG